MNVTAVKFLNIFDVLKSYIKFKFSFSHNDSMLPASPNNSFAF